MTRWTLKPGEAGSEASATRDEAALAVPQADGESGLWRPRGAHARASGAMAMSTSAASGSRA